MLRNAVLIIAGLVIGFAGSAGYRKIVPTDLAPIEAGRQSTGKNNSPIRVPDLNAELLSRYQAYAKDRSAARRVLLDEVVAVYMRTDPQECLATFRSLGDLSLSSRHYTDFLLSNVDLNDFQQVSRIASEFDGKTRDALFRSAFQRKVGSDPAEAFSLLPFMPIHLVEDLSIELAQEWGKRDGPAASQAFLRYTGVRAWVNPFREAVSAWAESDPDAALHFLNETNDPAISSMKGVIIMSLAGRDPLAALKLISPGDRIPSFLLPYLTTSNPKEALQLAEQQSGAYNRNLNLYEVVSRLDPLQAFQMAAELPTSQRSLFLIREKARALANGANGDAFALADGQSDNYQRTAAITGVTEGVFRAKGEKGVAELVERAASTSHGEAWLEAASSLILGDPLANISFDTYSLKLREEELRKGNIKLVLQKPGGRSANWNTLPPDIAATLLAYAERNWPTEKIAALRAKLQSASN